MVFKPTTGGESLDEPTVASCIGRKWYNPNECSSYVYIVLETILVLSDRLQRKRTSLLYTPNWKMGSGEPHP